MAHALDGIKVIDLAINYAGPTSSTYLADQGANVIKLERRIVGDTARRSGNTPFLKLNSYAFMAINRGKRSITLDISKPQGQEVLRDRHAVQPAHCGRGQPESAARGGGGRGLHVSVLGWGLPHHRGLSAGSVQALRPRPRAS